jgi:hypothetical protein
MGYHHGHGPRGVALCTPDGQHLPPPFSPALMGLLGACVSPSPMAISVYMEVSVIHFGRNWFIHRCTDAKQSSHRSGSPSLHLGLGPSSAQNFNDCLATMKITQRQVRLPSTLRQSPAHYSSSTMTTKRTQRQVQLSSTRLQRLQSIHSRARSDVLAPSFEYVVSLCPNYECVCSCDRGLGQSGRELLIELKLPWPPASTA